MTTKEIRNKISESKLPKFFNNLTVNINYPHIELILELKGISSIHDFFTKQVEGWQKHTNLPEVFQQSQTHFSQQINHIEQFVNNCFNIEEEVTITNRWNNIQNSIVSNNNYFTYNSSISLFLLEIHFKHPEYFSGACAFITNENRPVNKNELIGFLLAFEFDSKENSDLANRINQEKKSLKQLRKDFQNQINQTETDLIEHLAKSSNDYKEYVSLIDNFKSEKENSFEEWFNASQKSFNSFDMESKIKMSELEKTYEEKLRLEKPARYWQKKSTSYYSQGNIAKYFLFGILGISFFLLSIILITSPDYIFNTVFEGNKIAIVRWSIVFISLLSLIAFAVRALSKYMFSSYHLARDAEERHTLTFFYLSLLKGSEVNDEDRKLILQSLFSRTETGLLKDESGPTMPSNDLTGKIFGKP